MHPEPIYYDTMATPIGELLLVADKGGLTDLYFETHRYGRNPEAHWRRPEGTSSRAGATLETAREQLEAYFRGDRFEFTVPLATRGTLFQERVWRALRGITAGETITYGELACRIANPRAVRAAAGAVAHNPLSIIVPCHRVIGANGSLTGFGGGLERKHWLLRHEGVGVPDPELQLTL